MRIPNPTAAVAVWLAGASLVSAEGRGISVPQNSIVSFTFIPRGAAAPVFVLGELSQGLSITWRSPNKTIVVTEAYIKTKEGGPNGGKILAFGSAQDDLRPPTQSIPADGAGLPTNIPSPTPSGTRRRDEGGELRLGAANVADALANTGNPDFIELQVPPGSKGSQFGTILLHGQDATALLERSAGQTLFFELDWTDPANGSQGGKGKSFTHFFAVTQPENVVTLKATDPALATTGQPPAQVEEDAPSDGANVAKPDGGTSTATTGAGGGATPSTLPGGLISGEGGPAASGPAGLAVGAVAGIAVGSVIAGLAIIGALVWYLLRRRRSGDGTSSAGGYGNGRPSHRRTADLIAEKEATAGVTETPHSPYSEDGQHADRPAGGAGTTEPLRSEPKRTREFSPYTDTLPPANAVPSAAAAAVGSSSRGVESERTREAAPSQMSGQYRHLIEDDMTPEQIARMLEEEQHLDAAIEQAAEAQQSPRR